MPGPQPLTFGKPSLVPETGPPQDPPQSSMQAMQEEAEKEEDSPVDAPAEECHKPWFELTVLGPDRQPLKGAAVKIDLPALQEETTLDDQGFLRREDVEVEPGSFVVVVITEDDESGTTTRRVEVVPSAEVESVELEPSLRPQTDALPTPWEPC